MRGANEKCKKLPELTAGKIPETVASKIQMTPLQTTSTGLNWELGEKEVSYLVPQAPSQSHRTVSVIAQAEQAKEHNDKQDDVPNKRANN
jgi:methionine synthase I (cobalamin-dependent)